MNGLMDKMKQGYASAKESAKKAYADAKQYATEKYQKMTSE